ncbi:hypothetical protein BVC80_8917g34 [Macleaya cordata]|uniref:Uncharacterized protein n=1 Tax=Macleaya cordata TaxID=56857 RepID=A0A200QRT6_MACCD|nr:hypothetical protein BVC80_8917g34 [Macleaya cordata]
MKFIPELVISCCLSSGPSVGQVVPSTRQITEERRALMRLSSPSSIGHQVVVPTTAPQLTEEKKSLMRPSSAVDEEEPPPVSRKRGKLSESKSFSATQTQWKPSLSAISEDQVFTIDMPRGVKSDKKRAGKSISRSQIRIRDYGDGGLSTGRDIGLVKSGQKALIVIDHWVVNLSRGHASFPFRMKVMRVGDFSRDFDLEAKYIT